jgi:hypothetical protein
LQTCLEHGRRRVGGASGMRSKRYDEVSESGRVDGDQRGWVPGASRCSAPTVSGGMCRAAIGWLCSHTEARGGLITLRAFVDRHYRPRSLRRSDPRQTSEPRSLPRPFAAAGAMTAFRLRRLGPVRSIRCAR